MRQRLTWLAIFVVAFAYVESAVVVYLREIYYPGGFSFPVELIPDWLAAVEVGREAATILILLAAGTLMGSDGWERFLYFCIAFGGWDILYYFWLLVFLGWPPSLLTLDILFLIPVPWVAPVLAPLLIALSMMGGSIYLLRLKARGAALSFPGWLWGVAVGGGLLVLLSFTLDYNAVMEGRMPDPYPWWLFGAGLASAWAAFILGIRSLGLRPK
jgi:hypothetical protein